MTQPHSRAALNGLGQARGTTFQGSSIHWPASLTHPDNRARRPLQQLVRRAKRERRSTLNLILLDSSGSTLQQQNLQQALGVVQGLIDASYQQRQRVALIQFGNQQVQLLLPPGRAPKRIHSLLQRLQAGGGTPLREALQQGVELLEREARRHPREIQQLFLVSDCRSQDSLAGLPSGVSATLIDTEMGPVRLNRGPLLAQQLGARHLPLEQLTYWSDR
ncbi:vWA domain-containing protein [Aestuariirhabdus litorea]|nr:VWA domain-containing protein [Aestuariirhabdus litorea]